MPCGYVGGGIDSNPRKWEQCRRIIAKQMIEAGWNKHAGKFSEVNHRKALKLFYKT